METKHEIKTIETNDELITYSYGNPPLSSVVGTNSGECKEGSTKPCYNWSCSNCSENNQGKNVNFTETIIGVKNNCILS
jgi:hypothetical protein